LQIVCCCTLIYHLDFPFALVPFASYLISFYLPLLNLGMQLLQIPCRRHMGPVPFPNISLPTLCFFSVLKFKNLSNRKSTLPLVSTTYRHWLGGVHTMINTRNQQWCYFQTSCYMADTLSRSVYLALAMV